MRKSVKYFKIITSVALGLILVWGGIKKFEKPIPSPQSQILLIKSGLLDNIDESTLKIKNFIFGLKQTNYFWQLLGMTELIAGVLLISQIMRFTGALIAVPLTLNIFLFHLFLEFNDYGELIQTCVMLLGNLYLIMSELSKFKSLLFNKSVL